MCISYIHIIKTDANGLEVNRGWEYTVKVVLCVSVYILTFICTSYNIAICV
jgi:hypothetical protein